MDKTVKKRGFDYKKHIVYLSFLVILIVFSIILRDKGFLSYDNMMNILRQTAMISVAAVGMTFAISCGLIDLSTGSVVAVSALSSAMVLRSTNNIFLAIIVSTAIGFTCGLINGLIIAKVKIPAFLVTLGTNMVYTGVARSLTNLEAVSVVNSKFNFIFGSGNIGPISVLFLWTLLFAGVGHLILKKTTFGRNVLAVGGNESAAKFSGIKVEKIQIIAMIICGITAAFAGVLYAGRLHGARYTLGENDNMSVMAAVVIGGTSFTGGKGTVVGTLIGSIVIGMLNNGLLLMGLSVSEQMIARGIIIILAVSLSLRQVDHN